MSFLHMSLIAGLAVVTVPIMLHLFGQKQPQIIDFPALRFVRETTQEQSTSWQLRHFVLLLLRILLLAALALALARPRVHSAVLGSMLGVSAVGVCAILASLAAAVAFVSRRPASVWLTAVIIAVALWASAALWGFRSVTTGPAVPSSDQSAPVAVAMIVDNGPTMQYRADNENRLDDAKKIGGWILDQLPIESRVGILTGVPVGSLALDPSTAQSQLKLIDTRGAHVDLLARVRTALDLVLANELERKEIYVITDLMSTSWVSAQSDLKEMLDEHLGEVLVQVIDVGSDDQANWQLGDATPDAKSIPAGSDISIEVDVRRPESSQANTPVTVELMQEELDSRLPTIRNGQLQTAPSKVVDRKVVDLSSASSETITFSAHDLAEGTHHFTIRLDRPDPLDVDNERFVSIVAYPQQPALIVADNPELARLLMYIADPREVTAEERLAEQVRYAQLGQVELEKFSVVCLLDPPPLASRDVERLKQVANRGGGLLTILGSRMGALEQIRGNPLLELLPGQLGEIASRDRSNRTVFPNPVAISHPMFFLFGEVEVPWSFYPIFRSWTFSPIAEDGQVLMSLSDGSGPFVLSQNVGRGQIITFCSPLPQFDARGDALWNELWVADENWPAFALLSGAIRTLSGAARGGANFSVGLPIVLPNDSLTWPARYELFLPSARSRRVEAQDGVLSIGDFEAPGIYRLRAVRGDPISRGFSINAPAADTALERATPEQLDEKLGADNYRLAHDRDEVESSVGQARFGRELYPLLMVFVAGLFLAEQAMSNRFYKIKLNRSRGA